MIGWCKSCDKYKKSFHSRVTMSRYSTINLLLRLPPADYMIRMFLPNWSFSRGAYRTKSLEFINAPLQSKTFFVLKNGQHFLFLIGQSLPFCPLPFFPTIILQKNCRLERALNLDRRTRSRARWPLDHHHDPERHFFTSLGRIPWLYLW